MKIYTEVNYKWLDGQLVKTDSKSFEYEGEVTLCSTGGGGGGAAAIVKEVGEAVTNIVNTGTGVVESAGDAASDIGESAGEVVDRTLGQAGDLLEEGITTGGEVLGEGLAMNEGVATTLGDFGDMINEGVTSFGDKIIDDDLEHAVNVNVDKLHDYGKAVNTVISDELGRWEDTAMGFATDLGEAMGVGGDDGDDVAIPDKLKAVKRGLKNKARANLKVNKSLGRARSSLRIG